MKHVFVSPHPDDIALSCGGLVALLRDRGEPVAIVTVFSGPGPLDRLTPYQRLALGFGAAHRASPGEDEAVLRAEAAGPTGAGSIREHTAAVPTPAEAMAARRAEDQEYARSIGVEIVFLNQPDAVFRDYYGDALMGPPRPEDAPPVRELRRALASLEPDRLYIPFSIGGHVDHRQARRAACAIAPGPGLPNVRDILFYEDFPYALNVGFERLDQLEPDVMACLQPKAVLTPEYVQLGGFLEKKTDNLRSYSSQMGRLFGGDATMAAEVRRRAVQVGVLGGVGASERYWRVTWPGPAEVE